MPGDIIVSGYDGVVCHAALYIGMEISTCTKFKRWNSSNKFVYNAYYYRCYEELSNLTRIARNLNL